MRLRNFSEGYEVFSYVSLILFFVSSCHSSLSNLSDNALDKKEFKLKQKTGLKSWKSGSYHCTQEKCTKILNMDKAQHTFIQPAQPQNYSGGMESLNQIYNNKKKKCTAYKFKGFSCQKLKWLDWLLNKFEQNVTKVNDYIEIVHNDDIPRRKISLKFLRPENWPESVIYEMIDKWGAPEDRLIFYKFKEYKKKSQLKIKVPKLLELTVAPKTAITPRSSRTFFDPGFNLKLKLPFLRDELKVAVSTGPSFVVGIGVGILILMMKGIMAPIAYMMYNAFSSDGSPFDFLRMMGWMNDDEYVPPSGPPPPPPPRRGMESYNVPVVRNSLEAYKNMKRPPMPDITGFGYGYQNGQQFRESTGNSILETLSGASSKGVPGYMKSFPFSSGKSPGYHMMDYGNPSGPPIAETGKEISEDGNFEYIPPTAIQADVENYDPFYSPLLSRIDSIFMHLGHNEEGCRERVACSIYKFPVKYAPYSNLLSAQLSKNQNELERPVVKSSKILRYFRYMKAAKDGQGGSDCLKTYPNCDADTDAVSNPPMITTFHQLKELMNAESA